jgi:integrase
MPYKQPNSPYWWINLSFSGIGRVQKSTGTRQRAVATRMEAMLDRLYSSGKGHFIEELKVGLFSLPWLYTKDCAGELETLVTSTTARPFAEIAEWVENHKKLAPDTKRSYRSLIRTIAAAYPDRSIHDMPKMLRDYRERCEAAGVTRSFNQTRSVFQAYATAIDGKHKALWIEITNIRPIQYAVDSGNSLSYKDVRELGRKLIRPKNHPQQFAEFEILWSLVLTGMRKAEYLGNWSVAHDRVVIHNSKKSRQSGVTERSAPRVRHLFGPTDLTTATNSISGPVDPANRFQTFERRLREVSGRTISPHDFRHTYRTWLLLAGVPEVRAEVYMGHKLNTRDVRKAYPHHDVAPYLTEDAKKLEVWLDASEHHWLTFEYEQGIEFEYRDDPRDIPEIEYKRERALAAPKGTNTSRPHRPRGG